jgi:NAD(P)-dependent dehydrogenase (short-subunit alcohol dehydrogenase family)
MDLGLAGKVAVVTGAGRGIGLAVVRALAAEDVRVAAGSRTITPELSALAEGGDVLPVQLDMTDPDAPGRLVDAATGAFGGLDVLVNNVGGVRTRFDGFLAIDDDEWSWTLDVNFLAAVRTTRAALPHLLERAPATIVTVSSVNAFLADPAVVDYCAAKAALSTFCRALAREFGPRGVRVNTVSPGPVGTDLWLGDHGVAAAAARASGGGRPQDVVDQTAAAMPTGRFTTPAEVADVVLLLAGGRAGNVTGSDVVIDGGLVSTR